MPTALGIFVLLFTLTTAVPVEHDGAVAPSAVEDEQQIPKPERPLAEADDVERLALEQLQGSVAWPRRVIALLRLQRFDCPESEERLRDGLNDRHEAVRCFALLALGHRGVPQRDGWLELEASPIVIRTALRVGYHVDEARTIRGTAALARSSRLEDKLLAAELAMLTQDRELQELAQELVKTVILRMSAEEAGAFSPRLARLTGAPDLRRAYKWRLWRRQHRVRHLDAGRLLAPRPRYESSRDGHPTACPIESLSEVARLPIGDFNALAAHLEALALEPIDLAIVLDCTASMSGEIGEAQGGVDDLMSFVGDVSGGIRVAVAGYRDRREKFEQVGWDFASRIQDARRHLWKLSAEGGGDRPELVDRGLALAYQRFSWDPGRRGVLVLVGDAPPHPGRGTECIELARAARGRGITTHVIGCDPSIEDVDEPTSATPPKTEADPATIGPDGLRGVKRRRRWGPDREEIAFFPEIAAAGGGRVVNLSRDERLVPEIAGLIVGLEFEAPMVEFFQTYMSLCR